MDALDALAQLRDCSLILAEETEEGMRFRMLETLREYAAEQLAAEERAAVEQRHATYFLALAEEAEPQLTMSEQTGWLARLELERENLWAVQDWAAQSDEGEIGLRLSAAVWRYWAIRGHVREARRRLDEALAQVPATHSLLGRSPLRARALDAAGSLAHDQGDLSAAEACLEESLALWRHAEDRAGLAQALNLRAAVAQDREEYDRAIALYEEALELFQALGDARGEAMVLGNLGTLLHERSEEVERAVSLLAESVRLKRELGNRYGLAISLENPGNLERERGALDRAAALYEEALALRRELGHRQGIAVTLNNLAAVQLTRGDAAEARACLRESLLLLQEMDDPRALAECLASLARALFLQGQGERAAYLFGEAERLREENGLRASAPEAEAEVGLRSAMGETAFARAAEAGRAAPAPEVIAAALATWSG